jgi:hypothetical protein
MVLRPQQTSEPHVPQSDEASRGSPRAQINAYNSAIDDSPSHPPEPSSSPQGSLSSQQQQQQPSLDSVVLLLLEQLSRQFADTHVINEEAVASLECRFNRFIHESSDQVHTGSLPSLLRESSRATYANITDRQPSLSSTGTPHQYDDRRHVDYPPADFSQTGDVRQLTGTPNISNVMPSTPASTSFGARHRQSSMPALSPGPSRIAGASSLYPDNDPPVPTQHGLRGCGAPRFSAILSVNVFAWLSVMLLVVRLLGPHH